MAYGFVEVSGVTAAVIALDTMCKTSEIELVTWERKWGGKLVTIIVHGAISSVTESIEAAKQIVSLTASGVLANPHSEVVKLAKKSAKKFDAKAGV